MAILTQSQSTSVHAVRPASHACVSMPSEAARALRPALRLTLRADQTHSYLPAVEGVQPVSHNSITCNDTIVPGALRMRGVVDGKGATGSSVGNGAFVTSLGSRPPSPPV